MADACFVIRRTDFPLFFSAKLGRDFGQPLGGWTPRLEEATHYASFEDADRQVPQLGHMAPFVEVVAL